MTLHVVIGPGLRVDRGGITRSCVAWGHELGHDVAVRWADSLDELVAALAPAALSAARGVVIVPGALGDATAVRPAAATAGVPTAWVDLLEAERRRPGYLRRETTSIRGRGVAGLRWALHHLLQRLAWPYEVIGYGPGERDQVGDLRLPSGTSGPWPVAVAIHGGFWRERWERDTIEPLAIDLAGRGFATWNLEYRRTGPHGGGWPATAHDVATGIDHLTELARRHPLDLERVVVVGHSAGGQLALWSVRRHGSDRSPRVTPRLVVSLAGVADLVEAALRGLGDTGNATVGFMGGPPEAVADRYAAASPIAALPLGVPQLVAQGLADNNGDLIDLNRRYVEAARAAGDAVQLLELDGADHFAVIDPEAPCWPRIVERIEAVKQSSPLRTAATADRAT